MSVEEFSWQVGRMELTFRVADNAFPALMSWTLDGVPVSTPATPVPLAEVGIVGLGRSWSARRYLDSVLAAESICTGARSHSGGGREILVITSRHPSTGIELATEFTASAHDPWIRVSTTATNAGSGSIDLQWVTSGVLTGVLASPAELDVFWADNDWLAENRWHRTSLAQHVIDVARSAHEHDPRGHFSRTALGAWSTDGALPTGVVLDPRTDLALGWQVENNGPWHWQVGEHARGTYLSLLGPTDAEHQWSVRLAPGDQFRTVPAVFAVSATGWQGVLGTLTAARRATRRPHPDHTALPVVFNDYMNTLMGDPTTARLLPLIDAAAEVGAEIFCIDAGWYDDDAAGWWDAVGAWEPAVGRFPGGLQVVVDHIRSRGLHPGLWLEPELVGVRSPVADQLPEEAFFRRAGRRVVEHGRHHLDLRHPAAIEHLDRVVDRLVGEFGVRYFKFDHNVNPGPGTDDGSMSVGAALLEHTRALLAWYASVLDRHPELTLENCASGGMRSDHAQLAVVQLQSTSDQQDPLRYPPIAASAAASITPEQAASWAYPQPEDSDDLIAFTLNTPMLGRLYLSGHLDRMTAAQRDLVAQGVATHRSIRDRIPGLRPCWPWGLPEWEAGWVCHGLRGEAEMLLTIWRRDDPATTRQLDLDVDIAAVQILFPRNTGGPVQVVVDELGRGLRVVLGHRNQSVTVQVHLRS